MKFEDLVNADLRLVVLLSLAQDAGYAHNEYVLKEMLGHLGHTVSRDKLRTELAWLKEQGLVELADVTGTMVAKLTGRGKDVSEGAVVVPGVKRPEPM
ncbi:MAG: ArsR family transcriptional regulator [Desulfobulbus sp.]|jgi:hypothetical protein|uniref:VpaChn25_0724 family phage protein n=1 Tax=Desulfobulbus sp. TaxID=895 RepID=UPI00283E7A00|nr:ArsR family transcriptional regulator [Desulfobulbus sp.]MDR2551439.1 ArsR family transcriptional regulator [Desulfobulbus sp.]